MDIILQSNQQSFAARLKLLTSDSVKDTLSNIRHGVEREALRINPNGGLAQTPHQAALGSALTHEYITTDFSESLLEFITPPEASIEKTIGQLTDVHKFVSANIGEERLWSMSMPCFIESGDAIPIANYGSSNVGKMKSLYRVGLKNRYGSMMQAISGVHFNFSLPKEFWQAWFTEQNQAMSKDNISAAYFAMIRNYRRFCWIIPYLYGASPALCGSFIRGKKTTFEFTRLGKGTCYLPYATSLRMSDLGYTNSAQSSLNICYNHLDTYIDSLRKAISLPSAEYQQFEGKKDGEYQQLSSNVLQIENELYSPIRPKQPTRSLEKPTDALEDRGVEYIEVRALDVDPFSAVGIHANQFYFLDVFLVYCLVTPSAFFSDDLYQETEVNLKTVVSRGREPNLTLVREGESVNMQQWALTLFDDMQSIALLLDEANQTTLYSEALAIEKQKILDPSLTPSARLLESLLQDDKDNGTLGLQLAESYKEYFAKVNYRSMTEQDLHLHATESKKRQKAIEESDTESFDEFLADYFLTLREFA
jgi:glutamate--cysteine ligase